MPRELAEAYATVFNYYELGEDEYPYEAKVVENYNGKDLSVIVWRKTKPNIKYQVCSPSGFASLFYQFAYPVTEQIRSAK